MILTCVTNALADNLLCLAAIRKYSDPIARSTAAIMLYASVLIEQSAGHSTKRYRICFL